jgi:hypothetical protein
MKIRCDYVTILVTKSSECGCSERGDGDKPLTIPCLKEVRWIVTELGLQHVDAVTYTRCDDHLLDAVKGRSMSIVTRCG